MGIGSGTGASDPHRQHQRRWLVKDPRRLVRQRELRSAHKHAKELRDWFELDTDNPFNSTRFRLTDKTKLTLTVKTGPGHDGRRDRVTSPITHNVAALLKIKGAPKTIKRRYAFHAPKRLGGGLITVDVYSKPGRIAMIEWNDPPAGVTAKDLPAWMDACGLIDVTNALTSAHIANLPSFDDTDDVLLSLQDLIADDIAMLVLTGGPCSGKTSVMEALANDPRAHAVPEVATILIGQLGVKPFGARGQNVRFQIALRRVQIIFEALARLQARADGKSVVVMDRGVLDACAYLPDGKESYHKYFGVSADDDGKRYKAVAQLSVPDEAIFEANRRNNPSRRESHQEAVILGHKICESWIGHGNYLHINDGDWPHKKARALEFVYAHAA